MACQGCETCNSCDDSCDSCQNSCDNCQAENPSTTFKGWDRVATNATMFSLDEFNSIVDFINDFYYQHSRKKPLTKETGEFITAKKYNEIRDAIFGNGYDSFYNENTTLKQSTPAVIANVSIVTAECFNNLKTLTKHMAYDECSKNCENCNYCESGDSDPCEDCCNEPTEGEGEGDGGGDS